MPKISLWLIFGLGVLLAELLLSACSPKSSDDITQLMSQGNGRLEKGDGPGAISAYSQALKLSPNNADVRLNLANAFLLANDNTNAIDQCRRVLQLEPSSAAAFYLMGGAYARLNQPTEALQAFQQSQQIEPKVTALNFQLGLAHMRLGHTEDAIREFETVVKFAPEHQSAYYQLSRLYAQAGRDADSARALATHQKILAAHPVPPGDAAFFERCEYTLPRVVFKLAQPDPKGIAVKFTDATATAFDNPSAYRGPMAVIDYNHDGRPSLFVVEKNGFRLLDNQQRHFKPLGNALPGATNGDYQRILVGDLDNDGFDDVVALGAHSTQVFRFLANGQARDVTSLSGLQDATARDGLLADLDFTGRLDLLTAAAEGGGLRVYQNRGGMNFKEATAASGLPAQLPGTEHIAVEDWFNSDLPGVFAAHPGQPPVYFTKKRAANFSATNLSQTLPSGAIIATADLDNDLRPDLIVAGDQELSVVFSGDRERVTLPLNGMKVKGVLTFDYDNDGWLDIVAFGSGIRVWRNLGQAGFADVTATLGLDKVGAVDFLVAADFDNDGDTDLVASSADGLKYWRNDGGNANKQIKLRLTGTRSNTSALGVRAEVIAGNWRTIRTLRQSPLEIGVGRSTKLDTLKLRWFDTETTIVDVPVQAAALAYDEPAIPTGSCPNLYAWDGKKFRFVTDILGASPLGLPLSKTRFIEADPDEFVILGDEHQFPPKGGAFELRVTEELREVLYLDSAKLVVVDHPKGTLVCPTSKMLPGKPFLQHELWTLRPVATLQHATRSDGLDVTSELATQDGRMVSPVKLREPQLRGLAEPFSVTMDFGELPVEKPFVLVLNGWLRFGGGMANVAASLDPILPFPFPTLEAQLGDGSWRKVDTQVGTPAGKTKTILVDLANKLPAGTRRLRLTTAFELYLDSAAICERVSTDQTRVINLAPTHTDLHWRGFSDYAPLPPDQPLTPVYEKVHTTPPWRIAVSGWCTRYGPVDELLAANDNALVLLNGGDELALSFDASKLPPKSAGFVRDFLFFSDGWDKDADFHVGDGWRVEPLPFHGMDDQAYGREPRPAGLDDAWISKYNTRWVGPMVLSKAKQN